MLGIGFDTTQLEWFISKDKADDLQNCIDTFMTRKACSPQDAQILHGKLSSFAQMSDFLHGFRFHLTSFLRKFETIDPTAKLIPQPLKDDLWVWKKVINAAKLGLLLAGSFESPPPLPDHLCFGRRGGRVRMEGRLLPKSDNSRGPGGGVSWVFWEPCFLDLSTALARTSAYP